MSFTIHGIQHLGVGVPDHKLSWKWYRKFFGMDIPCLMMKQKPL